MHEVHDNMELWDYYSDSRVLWEIFKAVRYRELAFVFPLDVSALRYFIIMTPGFLRDRLRILCTSEKYRRKAVNIFMSVERVRKSAGNGRVLRPKLDLGRRWRMHVWGRDVVIDVDAAVPGDAPLEERISVARETAGKIALFLDSLDAPYSLVFSGARGFHVWVFWEDIKEGLKSCGIEPPTSPKDIASLVIALQRFIVMRSVGLTCPHVDACTFSTQKDLIRVPYTHNWKTGLICLPLSREQFEDFAPCLALPEEVLGLERLGWRGWVRRQGDPGALVEEFLHSRLAVDLVAKA